MAWTDRNRLELLGLLDDRCMDVLRDAHPAELQAVLDSSDGPKSTDQPSVDLDAMRRFDTTLQSLLEWIEPGINWGGQRDHWRHFRRTQRHEELGSRLGGWP